MKSLKLTVIYFFVTIVCAAQVSQKEKAALVSLYNATNGEGWSTSWDLSTQ